MTKAKRALIIIMLIAGVAMIITGILFKVQVPALNNAINDCLRDCLFDCTGCYPRIPSFMQLRDLYDLLWIPTCLGGASLAIIARLMTTDSPVKKTAS
nr:hypothetical protein [Candidatus Sigynarchaeota archaeon]